MGTAYVKKEHVIHLPLIYCIIWKKVGIKTEMYLYHSGQVPSVCQLKYNIQFIIFYKWCQVHDDIWMIQLLQKNIKDVANTLIFKI